MDQHLPLDDDPWGDGSPTSAGSGAGRATGSAGNAFSAASITCGVLALVLCPPGFGLAGIGLGVVALSRGERNARLGLGVSVVGLLIGLIISSVVMSQFDLFR